MGSACGTAGRASKTGRLSCHRLRFSMQQQPELRLVRYWVAVAEEANVTRAAERLHIPHPALSAAIKQLEGQLGVTLLDRGGGRGVTVTPAGAVLLERGRELLALADPVTHDGRPAARRARRGARPRRALLRTARGGRRHAGAARRSGSRAPARRPSARGPVLRGARGARGRDVPRGGERRERRGHPAGGRAVPVAGLRAAYAARSLPGPRAAGRP